jgi:nitrite reductase/ring-hydroxylating ferredoxin subunit/uncharacterized membrane protein
MNLQTLFHKLEALPDQLPWLDKMADKVQPAINRFYAKNGSTQTLENTLNGVWLGHPLHPVLTDIPIGAWTTAVTLDALESGTGNRKFGKGADAAIVMGAVASVATAAAGFTDWQHLRSEPRRVGMLHALLNTITLLLFGASLAARGTRNRRLGRKLALFGFSTLTLGAFFGGDLTYRLQIGTKHDKVRRDADTFVQVMAADDLPEGQMTRVMLEGLPVLLLRRGERIYAISETCSHLGGPLADGELRDDNSVVCPWHGSRFNLENGKVIDGPSTYSQTGYEARIFNQKIELRRMGQ